MSSALMAFDQNRICELFFIFMSRCVGVGGWTFSGTVRGNGGSGDGGVAGVTIGAHTLATGSQLRICSQPIRYRTLTGKAFDF